MFYMKYSTICLFAVILFDVCWGVVTRLFDMNQMSTDGWRVGQWVQWFPPDFFQNMVIWVVLQGLFLKHTAESNRFHLVIGDATSKMIEIKRRWRDLLFQFLFILCSDPNKVSQCPDWPLLSGDLEVDRQTDRQTGLIVRNNRKNNTVRVLHKVSEGQSETAAAFELLCRKTYRGALLERLNSFAWFKEEKIHNPQ